MFQPIEWNDAYQLWRYTYYEYRDILSAPVTPETIYVKYECGGDVYGFDWLEKDAVQKRKSMIANDPVQFFYFTRPSNKGTIHTAEMLADAQSDEERAAIWIGATAKELVDRHLRNGVSGYADLLYISACSFLRDRFGLWHHAMRRLVPEIMIPRTVLEHLECNDAEPVMALIQMNTLLLQNTWRILRYSSLPEEKIPKYRSRFDSEPFSL